MGVALSEAEYKRFYADIRRMRWDDGLTWEEISAACSMGIPGIDYRLKHGGYKRSDFPVRKDKAEEIRRRANIKQWTTRCELKGDEFIATVEQLRADGTPLAEITAYFHCATRTLKAALKKAGFCLDDFPKPAVRRAGRPTTQKAQTLCWNCANSVPCKRDGTGCSWSRRFIPVEGWTAEQAWLGLCNKDGKVTDTYTVHACPQFVKG